MAPSVERSPVDTFLRTVLRSGILDRDQLQECIDQQAGQPKPKPIGALLVENGILTTDQLNLVIEEQQRRLQETLPYAPTQRGAVAFGRLIVERGFARQEAVNEALRGILNTARAVRRTGGLPNTALQPAKPGGTSRRKRVRHRSAVRS